MLSFLQINVRAGELLFEDRFTDPDLTKNWEVPCGEWTAGDGKLIGRFRKDDGSLIYSRRQFPGDIILDFTGRMLSPCDNDLNFTFRADGWNYEDTAKLTGYIGGLNGWWTKRAGLERYPGPTLRALGDFVAEPERDYHIQTGIAGDTLFLAVDGKLLLTLTDPDPIASPDCARVGLGVYCSQIEFRDFRVYRADVEHVARGYTARF
ncbi:MAG: hypothetical protein IJT18_04535 [Oscillospiraceae bacterium]|nr:hypothetical protein [Oscillospiraceae bacterium]